MLMVTEYILTTNTFIFLGDYGFDLRRTGLTSLSPQLAIVIAIPYCGLMNDWYIERIRKKREFQPEWRLAFFAPAAVLAPVGCILVGVCAQNHQSYIAVLIGEALGEPAILATYFMLTIYSCFLVHNSCQPHPNVSDRRLHGASRCVTRHLEWAQELFSLWYFICNCPLEHQGWVCHSIWCSCSNCISGSCSHLCLLVERCPN